MSAASASQREFVEVISGPGPICAAAIHDGHGLRPEVAALMSLSDEDRLREEDPHTGAWTTVAPTRFVARHSRFEVDLNRPRARAVYRQPEDAWGLRVWQSNLPDAVVNRSLESYDGFYDAVRRELDRMAARHRRFVVLDLHSFNFRRQGPDAPADHSRQPDVNVGTGSLRRERWSPLIDRVLGELRAAEVLDRPLVVGENEIFQGGAFPRWVHATYPDTGCAIALEFKKVFMDEWTGELDAGTHQGVLVLLRTVIAAIEEELERLDDSDSIDYGDPARGYWRCRGCGYEILSAELARAAATAPFRCPDCREPLDHRPVNADTVGEN